jgi:hypothetical protein
VKYKFGMRGFAMENQVTGHNYKVLSGFTLKWIAIISMIIDHFGSIIMDGVISPYLNNGYLLFTEDMPFMVINSFQIKNICEIIGSIAFPIFCFLIVEGFIHTRSSLKYGIRMGIFAIISEIPYDIAHYNKIFEPKLQNVMFTLCVGIFTLILIKLVGEKFNSRKVIKILLSICVIVAEMGIALALRGEYVFLGVLSISLIYLLRRNKYLQLLGMFPLIVVSPWIMLALITILFYNGERGRGLKYFFYIFYPAHLKRLPHRFQ